MPRLSIAPSLLRISLHPATRPAPQNAVSLLSSRIGATRHCSGLLPTLRPTLAPRRSTIFRSPAAQPSSPASIASPSAAADLDLVPRTAVTAHPALGGAQQVRWGPRPTLSNASRLIQKRRHGFLSRIRTAKGRKLLARRRAKGRKRLSA